MSVTHWVVSYSGGVTSWAAAKLTVDAATEGDVVTLLFADTLIEAPDVYRFIDDGAVALGLTVTRIADGRTPWELFADEGMIGNNRVALCSRILKRDLIDRWRREHCDPDTSRHVVGMDWWEVDRFERHRAAMAAKGWAAEAPLIKKRIDKTDAIRWAKDAGLTLPSAYADGFAHANCGGMCVRAGIGHWSRLRFIAPDQYARAERVEERLRAKLGKNSAILKDRRGGETKPLPLRVLRERLDAEHRDRLPLDDGGGCGCALELDDA